jgi:hypothetical protein
VASDSVIMARALLLCLALFAAEAGGFAAQAEEEPIALTIRPSRVEEEAAEARARQERLERRMRQAEFAFRSICIACSPGERFNSSVPFEPLQALRSGR